jgi:hypothetical protein
VEECGVSDQDKSRERVVGFVPLPAGWTAVYLLRDPGGDLEAASDHDLYYTLPVACLAHVEVQWYGYGVDLEERPGAFNPNVETHLRPVITEENTYLSWSEDSNPIDHLLLLGPDGDPVDVRGFAIRALEEKRTAAARQAA